MLQHLSIENYALIEKLEINFSRGFSVITGETGAGKSIILGALGLILGQRADSQALLDKEQKCIVEGSFDVSNLSLSDFFQENDLDEENVCVLRREITPTGKSRAFINDTPVSLQQMKVLGEKLIDIHSQHKTLTLAESSFQLNLLDMFAQTQGVLQEYTQFYKQYKQIQKELDELIDLEKQSKLNQDYYQFLFNELSDAKLENENQEELEADLLLQTNAESIKQALLQLSQLLDESEFSVTIQLSQAKSQVQKVSGFHESLQEIGNRLSSSTLEIKDIYNEIVRLNDTIHFSEEQQQELSNRLNTIYDLERKHQVNTLAELLAIQEDLDTKLQNIAGFGEQILQKEKELQTVVKKLSEKATLLTQKRTASAQTIETQIKTVLAALGMPNAQFKVNIETGEEFSPTGQNSVLFLFNANLGGQMGEIAKVASGGELSRLMLAIKSLITQNTLLPTIIFDEIDSGVSGDISLKVGEIMLQMSKRMQVIAITHLPQIAAKAAVHFKVYKQNSGNKTLSIIKPLPQEERVVEIATMLSSENPTEAALKTAKELMQ